MCVFLFSSRILQTNTWNDFYSLFSNKKSEFTETTFYYTASHINKLLCPVKFNANYAKLAELAEVIKKIAEHAGTTF